jgi:dolichyl-phosphate beta-glucosyltransferase
VPARVFVAIPAYNESARLPRLLNDLTRYLGSDDGRSADLDVHFCIVDDGSRTDEFDAERRAVEGAGFGPRVRIIRLDTNRGKGGAIRAGLEAGLEVGFVERFDYLGFMDADCAVPVSELHRALEYLIAVRRRDANVVGVIGARIRILGRSVVRSPLRHYMGRVFATFVSLWFGEAVYDTQCGLKIFEREALQRHIDAPADERWVWDTQLLLAMLHAGERIHEVPVDWSETGGSKLSLIRDPLTMCWRLITFRKRLRARSGSRRSSERHQ